MYEMKKFNGDFITWLKKKLDPEGLKKEKKLEEKKKQEQTGLKPSNEDSDLSILDEIGTNEVVNNPYKK